MDGEERPVVVAGWIGSTNLGDELVFEALRRKLEARSVPVVAVSVDPTGTGRDHGVRAVSQRRLLVGGSGPCRAALFGGGGLLQDETSPFNLPYHLSRLAALRWSPFAAVGLGAGPLRTKLGRRLTRAAMSRAVAVSVRDEGSADVLIGLRLRRPVVAADLALSIPRPQVEVRDRLVVALRPWGAGRSILPVGVRRPRAPAPGWFVDGAARALDECAVRTGLAVHLVAFQRGRDDVVHELVAAQMRTPVTMSTPTLATVLEEVASGRAVVAMRYHAAIAAALGGRPAVLLGYSPKVPSLASDLGAGAASLAWSPDDVAELPRALEAVIDSGDAMSESRERLRARETGNDHVLDRLLAL